MTRKYTVTAAENGYILTEGESVFVFDTVERVARDLAVQLTALIGPKETIEITITKNGNKEI